MSSGKSKNYEYNPLTPSGKKATERNDYSTMSSATRKSGVQTERSAPKSQETAQSEQPEAGPNEPRDTVETGLPPTVIRNRKARKIEKDRELLDSDRWLIRNGHSLTYFGLYLFSIMVLFRPFEIVPGMEFLGSTTFYFAIATMAIFIPSQIVTEGNLTVLSTEVRAVLTMTLIALVTMPIARDITLAWSSFNDPYIKAVVIFIVLVNVVRTRKRLMGLMWLSFGIGVYLSITTIQLYIEGKFAIEGYRVAITEVKGIFGNPNEMALHFVMMTPILVALGLASKNRLMRLMYFMIAVLFVAANTVTFSRGGFLGLVASSAVLVWKLGRKNRLNVSIVSIIIAVVLILAAPGNYAFRLLSIFDPSLDAVGSADARREGLITSIIVTIRNPWGIGIGNSSIFGAHNLQTHNAFTQVSSELGLLGLAAYLVFIISPFRKIAAIERVLFERNELDWFYFVSIGLQASVIGYLVSSFFASVAYNWFIYYLIAYVVAFRRVYSLERGKDDDIEVRPLWEWRPAEAK